MIEEVFIGQARVLVLCHSATPLSSLSKLIVIVVAFQEPDEWSTVKKKKQVKAKQLKCPCHDILMACCSCLPNGIKHVH